MAVFEEVQACINVPAIVDSVATVVLSEATDDVRCKAARIYSRLEDEVVRKPGSQ